MLGSGFEAEDAVQETMVRAWRAGEDFEGRSSVRSWLYRIATNVCLDMLRGRQRRARPMELGPSSPAGGVLAGAMLPEGRWISPIADARVLPPEADPAELAIARESVRLAFVAALQHLPGPPAGGADPLRGAALAGVRGGRAAGHQRGGGQQRPAAGPGDPGTPRPRRRRRRSAPTSTSCSPATLTPSSATT